MDALAAHLNELGIQQSSQPEAPPRNNRNSKQSNNNNVSTPSSANNHTPPNNQASANNIEALVDSETDSEPEDNGRGVRNDGTLLASDPPKPLLVFVFYFKNIWSFSSINLLFR